MLKPFPPVVRLRWAKPVRFHVAVLVLPAAARVGPLPGGLVKTNQPQNEKYKEAV